MSSSEGDSSASEEEILAPLILAPLLLSPPSLQDGSSGAPPPPAPALLAPTLHPIPKRRAHRRARPEGEEALPGCPVASRAIHAIRREARETARADAIASTVDANLTECDLEMMVWREAAGARRSARRGCGRATGMRTRANRWLLGPYSSCLLLSSFLPQEVEHPLLEVEIAHLTHRLHIKIREKVSLEARLRVARCVVLEGRARARDARMARIREQRLAEMAIEMRMENLSSLSAPPPAATPATDLTRAGIEPNPGPGSDSLIRVVLLPASSPPIVAYIDVPADADFPNVPAITGIYGDEMIENCCRADHPDLVLFGSHFKLEQDAGMANTNLENWLERLCPIGSYVLVSKSGNVPDSITAENVMAEISFGEEWEESYILEHDLQLSTFDIVYVESRPDTAEVGIQAETMSVFDIASYNKMLHKFMITNENLRGELRKMQVICGERERTIGILQAPSK
jgi:hypothetical protein